MLLFVLSATLLVTQFYISKMPPPPSGSPDYLSCLPLCVTHWALLPNKLSLIKAHKHAQLNSDCKSNVHILIERDERSWVMFTCEQWFAQIESCSLVKNYHRLLILSYCEVGVYILIQWNTGTCALYRYLTNPVKSLCIASFHPTRAVIWNRTH